MKKLVCFLPPVVLLRIVAAGLVTVAVATSVAGAQQSRGRNVPQVVVNAADKAIVAAHIELTPRHPATAGDSTRASRIVDQLRSAIAKYRDVRIAEADGFKMFAPQIKNQSIYHFTKGLWAIENQFRFNPEKPTSLLYVKNDQGIFVLIGAMYTAPKRYTAEDLDKRVPTSIAQWHKHVNWCLPPRRRDDRWSETKDGRPVFGPLGVATREACDSVGGRFVKEVLGWMVHANVFESNDPAMIWSDTHMRGDEMMDRHGPGVSR